MGQQAYRFNYLRANIEEVAIGPFLTREEAENKQKRMVGFGAKCTAVYPVDVPPENLVQLKAEKDGYVAGKVAEFRTYLAAELDVLDAVHIYHIIYKYINPLRGRVMEFLRAHMPDVTPGIYTKEVEGKFALYKVEYLMAVAEELESKSGGYGWADGSVPEDIGKLLKELSKEVLRLIRQ
jgi:hypothetical protein